VSSPASNNGIFYMWNTVNLFCCIVSCFWCCCFVIRWIGGERETWCEGLLKERLYWFLLINLVQQKK
jgi:hypothetical protein